MKTQNKSIIVEDEKMMKKCKVKKVIKLLKSLPKDYVVQIGTIDKNVITEFPVKGFYIDEMYKTITLNNFKG